MKFISKLQANKGLRAMLNIGAKGREQPDVSRPHCLGIARRIAANIAKLPDLLRK